MFDVLHDYLVSGVSIKTCYVNNLLILIPGFEKWWIMGRTFVPFNNKSSNTYNRIDRMVNNLDISLLSIRFHNKDKRTRKKN
jgi:hypothetical protein